MKRIILYRFHNKPNLCSKRIDYYNKLNKDVDIYGLGEDFDNIEKLYENGLKHNYTLDNKVSRWKWLNGDLFLKNWYEDFGKRLDFDILHMVEWDLLLTDKLKNIYDYMDRNKIALSGLMDFEKSKKYNWHWSKGKGLKDYEYLNKIMKDNLDSSKNEKYSCIFPGFSIGRDALEDYCRFIDNIPKICNDECRMVIYGNHSDYELVDTGFYNWGNYDYFNSNNSDISLDNLNKGLKDGRKAFHPVRGLGE